MQFSNSYSYLNPFSHYQWDLRFNYTLDISHCQWYITKYRAIVFTFPTVDGIIFSKAVG
uniref:Uncharacterized protein n=1 Tax=Myoviridae sp. ctoIO8 TaxID=2825173 RepID=A0A8S5P1B9_9CAUD|nr:MAG TPA: hypothetical protein [Myoviridae sp. ctoIO8]